MTLKLKWYAGGKQIQLTYMCTVLFPVPLEMHLPARPAVGFSHQRTRTACKLRSLKLPSCHKLSFQAQWQLPKTPQTHTHTQSIFNMPQDCQQASSSPDTWKRRMLCYFKRSFRFRPSLQCLKRNHTCFWQTKTRRHAWLSARLLV